MLTEISFKIKSTVTNQDEIVETFRKRLAMLLQEQSIVISIRVDDANNSRKRYFAMVSELSKHVGYNSTIDRETFKAQLKKHFNVESIETLSKEEVLDLIEQLHHLASMHYEYKFKEHESDSPIQFNS